jgi:dTDP-4-dehydrorhamnose reductase
MYKKILLTGGTGRLGTELKKHLKGFYPTRRQLDITDMKVAFDCDLVVHMAGYTNVNKAEVEKDKCFEVNVLGTFNMLNKYKDKPFVFISTENVRAKGVYWESKLAGEFLVKTLAKNYLIIRTLFKTNPWQYEFAFKDQITQGDYVDVIAPLIAKEIKKWKGNPKTVYVGTGRKTMLELAKRTKPDVKPNSVEDLPLKRPKDYL